MRLVQPPLVDLSWSSASLDAESLFLVLLLPGSNAYLFCSVTGDFLDRSGLKLTAQSSEALLLDLGVTTALVPVEKKRPEAAHELLVLLSVTMTSKMCRSNTGLNAMISTCRGYLEEQMNYLMSPCA
jgi:hypothetical protein